MNTELNLLLEDIQNQPHQTVKVLAFFGGNLYVIQQIETTLRNALSSIHNHGLKKGRKHLLMNLGGLVKELKKSTALDLSTQTTAGDIASIRNTLAHDYWVKRAAKLLDNSGQKELLSETRQFKNRGFDEFWKPLEQVYDEAIEFVCCGNITMADALRKDLLEGHRFPIEYTNEGIVLSSLETQMPLTTEIFALYGSTCYTIQHIEAALPLVIQFHLIKNGRESEFKQSNTFGQFLNQLDEILGRDRTTSISQPVKHLRNWFAHHYWRHRGWQLSTESGQRELMAELLHYKNKVFGSYWTRIAKPTLEESRKSVLVSRAFWRNAPRGRDIVATCRTITALTAPPKRMFEDDFDEELPFEPEDGTAD